MHPSQPPSTIHSSEESGTYRYVRDIERLSGHVEVDETFIGGLARNMHERKRKHAGTGGAGKVAVMGLLERHGEVKTHVVNSVRSESLQPHTWPTSILS